jgi:hypothetical protein
MSATTDHRIAAQDVEDEAVTRDFMIMTQEAAEIAQQITEMMHRRFKKLQLDSATHVLAHCIILGGIIGTRGDLESGLNTVLQAIYHFALNRQVWEENESRRKA